MKGYLSIGAVSKEKKISIKSLRYYEKKGVFMPAYVNEATGYRFYTEDQLYVLDAVSLCVELGIKLRDFDKYVDEDGTFNLQRLLYDGKLLAEQKISDIRTRLGAVQTALRNLENTPLDADLVKKTVVMPSAAAAPEPEPEPAPSIDSLFNTKSISERCVLTSPYAEDPAHTDSQQILRLFMRAQLLGMTATYPAGIIYDYDENGEATKSLFIHVENPTEIEDKRIRTLPDGEYRVYTGTPVESMTHSALMEAFDLTGKPSTIIEMDLVNSEKEERKEEIELQILM